MIRLISLIIFNAEGGKYKTVFYNSIADFGVVEWPRFLSRHKDNPIIGGLPITRAIIRQTVLQLSYFDNDADISIAQAIAGHKNNEVTFRHYLRTSWMKRAMQRNVRHFMKLFEAAIAQNIKWEKGTRYSEAEMAKRKNEAEEKGLSFYCATQVADVAVLARKGPSCTPLTPCADCPATRFVPSDVGFHSLAVLGRALDEASERLATQNPKRWYAVWLPWHALTIAYHRRIARSPYQFAFNRARESVDRAIEEGTLSIPEIY